ncbi:hypothetical protein PEC18_10000 [Paucibacter sp. O1-1]|nr:hypothetical protein [Paucibacter sp. O1-1]MDA3826180.1 hypothetical protein [Paucibacter sp. O1-1]
MVFTINVLASPGTPSSKQCPDASKEISISSIASCCPTMSLGYLLFQKRQLGDKRFMVFE